MSPTPHLQRGVAVRSYRPPGEHWASGGGCSRTLWVPHFSIHSSNWTAPGSYPPKFHLSSLDGGARECSVSQAPQGLPLLSADCNLRNTLERNANSPPREHAVPHCENTHRPRGPTCFSILGPAFFVRSAGWWPDRRDSPGELLFCVVQRVCGLTNGSPGVKLILLNLKIKKKV